MKRQNNPLLASTSLLLSDPHDFQALGQTWPIFFLCPFFPQASLTPSTPFLAPTWLDLVPSFLRTWPSTNHFFCSREAFHHQLTYTYWAFKIWLWALLKNRSVYTCLLPALKVWRPRICTLELYHLLICHSHSVVPWLITHCADFLLTHVIKPYARPRGPCVFLITTSNGLLFTLLSPGIVPLCICLVT